MRSAAEIGVDLDNGVRVISSLKMYAPDVEAESLSPT